MRPFILSVWILLSWLSVSAPGEILTVPLPIIDTVEARPERLYGANMSKDFFISLPTRRIEANSLSGTVYFTPSPIAVENSVAVLKLNGVTTATQTFSGNDGTVPLQFEGPAESDRIEFGMDPLRLTVEFMIRLPENYDRDESTSSGQVWVEIDPSSEIQATFDSRHPDWSAIARLPETLRDLLVIQILPEPNESQIDLTLKVACWLAYINPTAEILVISSNSIVPANADHFRIKDPEESKASITIEVEGSSRIITLMAENSAQVEQVWQSLLATEHTKIPGHWWAAIGEGDPTPIREPQASVPLHALPSSTALQDAQYGRIARRFYFDRALFGKDASHLELSLAGNFRELQRTETAVLGVFLNDYPIFTDRLNRNRTDFAYEIDFDPQIVYEENNFEIRVDVGGHFGADPSATSGFFWELNPSSNLSLKKTSRFLQPKDLLGTAQRFFARSKFPVLIGSGEDITVACLTAIWLQRVNSAAPLTPFLSDELPKTGPALVVGRPEMLGDEKIDLPLSTTENGLLFSSPEIFASSSIQTQSSLGIFQVTYRNAECPIMVTTYQGPRGEVVLQEMMSAVANEPWRGRGDILLADESSLPYAFFSDRMKRESSTLAIRPSDSGSSWNEWRWGLVGGIWIFVSALIFWIFTKSRENAAKG